MDFSKFENHQQFEVLLKKHEDNCLEKLIGNHKSLIKVSQKTAIKNLPLLFSHTVKIGNSKGFNATSLRDLSKESGMSLGAIYTYIASKDDLLLMLHHYNISVVESVFNDVTSSDDDMENLLTTIRVHLYLSQSLRPWFYFAFTETKHLCKKLIALSKESELKSELYFRKIIELGISKNNFKPVNTDFASSMIKALLQDWYLKPWKYQSRNINVDDYYFHMKDLVQIYLR